MSDLILKECSYCKKYKDISFGSKCYDCCVKEDDSDRTRLLVFSLYISGLMIIIFSLLYLVIKGVANGY